MAISEDLGTQIQSRIPAHQRPMAYAVVITAAEKAGKTQAEIDALTEEKGAALMRENEDKILAQG